MFPHFLVAGGDERSRALFELLRQDKFSVSSKALFSGDEKTSRQNVADVVLLPYPYSQKNGMIPSAFCTPIPLNPFLKELKPNALVFYQGEELEGGGEGIRFVKYASDDAFLDENTAISAEGALCSLMQETDDTLCNLRCLITGYGKFARKLSELLRLHGAKTTVAARSQNACIMAEEEGNSAFTINEMLQEEKGEWDAVLNTVPARIITEGWVERQKKQCLFLELAPVPGGFNVAHALEKGYRVKSLPGIPGKYAPKAAARALQNTVLKRIKELI